MDEKKYSKSCGYALRVTGFFLIAIIGASGCAKTPASVDLGSSALSASKSGSGEAVVKTARTGIGIKYKSGGNTPETGFDCSGFVVWTYRQHGYNMPRTTKEQMKIGNAVKSDALKPGDLVVFKPPRRRGGYHTGIYTGNGKFIHSPSSGGRIREDSMSDAYWKKCYVSARRVVR